MKVLLLRLLGLLLLMLLALPVLSMQANTLPTDFISVADGQFSSKGQPFHFVGANLSITWAEDRANAIETIEHAAKDGITVARVWALGEAEADADQWFYHNGMLRAGPDGWIEEGFVHLDKIVAAASRNNIKLIVVLANRWSDLGGLPQYLRWAGLNDQQWWRFYQDERCRAWYQQHLARIILRRNTITNRLYRDEPAIMAWELGNELNSPPGKSQLLTDWAIEMAAAIRRLDPNHLIGAGVESYQTAAEREWWLDLHRRAHIDYADIHVYPDTSPWIEGWDRLERLLAERAATAFDAGLPFIIGEYGFLPTTSEREQQMARFIRLAREVGAAGSLVWSYGPSHANDGYHISFRDSVDDAIREMMRGVSITDWEFATRRQHYPLIETELRAEHTQVVCSRSAGRWQVKIPVSDYTEASWSRWGFWQDHQHTGKLSHVYGWQEGQFSYTIHTPRLKSGQRWLVRLDFRASTEWPGVDSPRDWVGQLVFAINGHRIAALSNHQDDGKGTRQRLWLHLPANQDVRLDFLIPGKPIVARGLCLYDHIELHGNRLPRR